MLRWDYGSAIANAPTAALPPIGDEAPGKSRVLAFPRLLRYAAAACLALLIAGSAIFLDHAVTNSFAKTAGEGGPIAVITDAVNAKWQTTELPTKVGSPLKPGWLHLRSGVVTIELLGGGTIIIDGPAELGLNSTRRVFLKSGKLTACVGESHAPLVVATPTLLASGEGPHFGVTVDPGNLTEAHALAGRLTITQLEDAPEPLHLEEGSCVRLSDSSRGVSVGTADPAKFARLIDLFIPDPPAALAALDFRRFDIQPYGYQDGQHNLPTYHEVSAYGSTLKLQGNAWKMLELNQPITRDTVVEFEFRSTHVGEIHGFGFDQDNHYSSDDQPIFQLYGYEVLPKIGQQFNNYEPSGWKKYRIRVGRYLPAGKQRYLYFAADDDVTALAEGEFRNVRIYEAPSTR
jgi:hypothetical protein